MELYSLLIGRICKPMPERSFVISQSFPITHFGDIARARVATIGINPSVDEFCNRKKPRTLLAPNKKRVVDREILRVTDREVVGEIQARTVIDSYNRYFETGNAYSWFTKMATWVLEPLNLSYKRGEVVHLDLVQWATDPVWSRIKDESIRNELVHDDSQFLAMQIRLLDLDLILLNGKTVVSAMRSNGHFEVEREGTIPGTTRSFFVGRCDGKRAVGWNINVQAQNRRSDLDALSTWLKAEGWK